MDARTVETIREQVAAGLWGRAVVELFVDHALREAVEHRAAGDLEAMVLKARMAADLGAVLEERRIR